MDAVDSARQPPGWRINLSKGISVTVGASGFGCYVPPDDWIGAAQRPSNFARGFLRAPLNLASPEPVDTRAGQADVFGSAIFCDHGRFVCFCS